MQTLMNLLTNPGVTGLLGVVLGVVLNSYFVNRREERRLEHESKERREQWEREAAERKEQRAHEAAMQKDEDRDRRSRAYARFLGTAHTVGQQMRNITRMTREDLIALSESYAETDVVAESEDVRREAYSIFESALSGQEPIIDTDSSSLPSGRRRPKKRPRKAISNLLGLGALYSSPCISL